jgi:uncharacterized membrane protein
MGNHLEQLKFTKRLGGTLLVVLLLSLGILLRVANLDQKVFWVDEVATVIRAAGYTRSEVTMQLSDGRLYSPAALLSYQHISPERPLADTLRALARSPEHAPLYFLLSRFWMQIWGSSVSAVRSLSVLCSLLTLPCIYWFCRELFGSVRVSWSAVLLMAVSPFFVAYAQEARPYSLWLLTVVGCSGALLRAMRLQTASSWAVYRLTLTASLYTSLLSGLLAIGQGIYIAQEQPTALRRFLAAASMAIVAFLPWIWVILRHWEALGSNTTWMRTALHPLVMLAVWLYSFAVLFFDVPVVAQGWIAAAQAGIAASILATIGGSIYGLRNGLRNGLRTRPHQVSFLLMTLCLPIPVALILLDLIFQGQASATTRYLMPSQFGVLVATAAFLAMPLDRPVSVRLNQIRQISLICLILLSLISGRANLNRSPDYQKDRNRANPAIAAMINQSATPSAQPLLLAEPEQTIDLLSLSHHLDPAVQIQILPADQFATQLAPSATFEPCQRLLFTPSASLLSALRQIPNLRIQQRYQPDLLTPTDLHLSLWSLQSTQCHQPHSRP